MLLGWNEGAWSGPGNTLQPEGTHSNWRNTAILDEISQFFGAEWRQGCRGFRLTSLSYKILARFLLNYDLYRL